MEEEMLSRCARPQSEIVPDWGPRQPPPQDEERVEDLYDFRIGESFPDADGRLWVFIGWRLNSAGRNANFVREVAGYEKGDPMTYSVVFASTLERKLPSVKTVRA